MLPQDDAARVNYYIEQASTAKGTQIELAIHTTCIMDDGHLQSILRSVEDEGPASGKLRSSITANSHFRITVLGNGAKKRPSIRESANIAAALTVQLMHDFRISKAPVYRYLAKVVSDQAAAAADNFT